MGRPVKDKQEVAHVGAISANNDPTIGELLADALERVGKDGVITVEEGKTRDTDVNYGRVVQGMALLQAAGVPQVGLMTEPGQ